MLIVRLTSELQPAVIPWVLLYLGPDALMPFVSGLAAIAGVLLVFWNKVVGFARKLLQIVTRRPDSK
jgi:hypothetical protein